MNRSNSVSTPYLRYDPNALRESAELATQRGQQWRYQGVDIRAAVDCERISVATLEELSAVPGGRDVLITRPILNSDAWCDALSQCERVTMTIDHFVHLEALMAAPWRQPPKVLLEVAVGPGRFGGRPGRDAVDLAKVVASQESVQFAGLTAEVRSAGMADSLLQTREQIEASGVDCAAVSVACPFDVCGQLAAGLEVRHDGGAFQGCATRIVSRPSLELAVIDIGFEAGFVAKQQITLELAAKQLQSTVRIRHVDHGRTLITLPEEAQDIVINEIVVLPDVRILTPTPPTPID